MLLPQRNVVTKSLLLKILAAPLIDPRTLIPSLGAGWECIKSFFARRTIWGQQGKYHRLYGPFLAETVPSIRRQRRCATVMMYLAIALLLIGIAAGNPNMIIMSIASAFVCALDAAKCQYQLYMIADHMVMPFLLFLDKCLELEDIFLW